MKKKLFYLVVFVTLAGSFLTGCTEQELKEATDAVESVAKEALDQAENLSDSQDSHVLAVKNGHPQDYPDKSYGDAFDAFFSYPTWKYFKGTKEGPDEDGDGKPDYKEEEADIVEFTGHCTYLDSEVKALIQFTLSKENDTFEATYLSFNDVSQNMLMLYGILEAAFSDGESSETAADTKTEFDMEENQDESSDADYETIPMETLAGSYSREIGPKCSLSIWSADQGGIFFAMGIGSSGYMAYVDLRDCTAEWTDENTAVYRESYGNRNYTLTFTFLGDGIISLSESEPYDESFPLAGNYITDEIAEGNCEFVFPEDDVFPIDASDLNGKTPAECKIARNEIYARHGRMFQDEQLQGYFDTCSWYRGTTAPENFSDTVLNEIEKANLQTIAEYEATIQ